MGQRFYIILMLLNPKQDVELTIFFACGCQYLAENKLIFKSYLKVKPTSIIRVILCGTHYSVKLVKAMQIKCLVR